MDDEQKLIEIRKVCLEIDAMIQKNPSRWLGSLEWVTGKIMCIAKYGTGYTDSTAPRAAETVH